MGSGKGRWVRIWLVRVVCVVAGLWALYLVAMNVFVRTHLFRNLISSNTDVLRIEYASAWSILPSRIEVRELHIRGRDDNVEWVLGLDRVTFTVGFADLARREFHARDVHGDGMTLRLRRRQPSFSPQVLAGLPPVPGCTDPPYSPPPSPSPTDAEYRLWSVWLEDVVADHVREVWVDTLRFTGELRITGQWFLKPIRWLELGPVSVEAPRLEVGWGAAQTLVSGATANAILTVHPGDVRDYPKGGFLDHLSVNGRIEGKADLAAMVDRASGGGKVKLERADSQLAVRVALDHGVLRPDTSLRIPPTEVRGRAGDVKVAGTLSAEAEVPPGGVESVASKSVRLAAKVEAKRLEVSDETLRMRVGGDVSAALAATVALEQGRVDVSRTKVELSNVTAQHENLSGSVPRIELWTDGVTRTVAGVLGRVGVKADEIHLPDMPFLAGLLPFPDGLRFEGGTARAKVHADLDLGDGTASGEVRVESRGVQVHMGKRALHGDLEGLVKASRARGKTDLSGSYLSFQEPGADGWWAKGDVRDASIDARGSPRFRTKIGLAARDALPLADLLKSNGRIAGSMALHVVPSSNLVGTGDVVLGPSLVEARAIDVRASGFEVNLELARVHGDRAGAIYVVAGPFSAGVDLRGDDTDVHLIGAENWFVGRVSSIRAEEQRIRE